jgi:hypothetical protein
MMPARNSLVAAPHPDPANDAQSAGNRAEKTWDGIDDGGIVKVDELWSADHVLPSPPPDPAIGREQVSHPLRLFAEWQRDDEAIKGWEGHDRDRVLLA